MPFGIDDMIMIGTALGAGASQLGSGGKLDKTEKELLRRRKWMSEKSFNKMRELEPGMLEDADFGGIQKMAPMFFKAIQPYLEKLYGRTASRFGIRSPYTTGTMQAGATQAMAGPMSDAYMKAYFQKFQDRGLVYGARTRLASV